MCARCPVYLKHGGGFLNDGDVARVVGHDPFRILFMPSSVCAKNVVRLVGKHRRKGQALTGLKYGGMTEVIADARHHEGQISHVAEAHQHIEDTRTATLVRLQEHDVGFRPALIGDRWDQLSPACDAVMSAVTTTDDGRTQAPVLVLGNFSELIITRTQKYSICDGRGHSQNSRSEQRNHPEIPEPGPYVCTDRDRGSKIAAKQASKIFSVITISSHWTFVKISWFGFQSIWSINQSIYRIWSKTLIVFLVFSSWRPYLDLFHLPLWTKTWKRFLSNKLDQKLITYQKMYTNKETWVMFRGVHVEIVWYMWRFRHGRQICRSDFGDLGCFFGGRLFVFIQTTKFLPRNHFLRFWSTDLSAVLKSSPLLLTRCLWDARIFKINSTN